MVYVPLFQSCVLNFNEKMMAFHQIDMTAIIPQNFLTLSVSMKALDESEIIAKYPEEIATKLLNTNTSITDRILENNDKFAIDRELPKIDMGDYLIIHDTGAHGFSMGYNYNGRLWSAEVLLKEDGSAQLIRRAQTPKDYFATFDCFPVFDKLEK